jgi:hypothetical protein
MARQQPGGDEVCPPGGTVLVSNGLYQTGRRGPQRAALRVAVTSAITFAVSTGRRPPSFAARPDRAAAVRCAYVGAGAVCRFTLTKAPRAAPGPR